MKKTYYYLPDPHESILLMREDHIVEEWAFICDLLGFKYEETDEIRFRVSDIQCFGKVKQPLRLIGIGDLIKITGGSVHEVTKINKHTFAERTNYVFESYDITITGDCVTAVYKKDSEGGYYLAWKLEDDE